MPHQTWPAIPSGSAATLFALIYQLEQSERWDPETLRAAQHRQLEPLLRHARDTAPGYRKQLKRWTGRGLEGVAILTRDRYQKNLEAFRSRAAPKERGRLTVARTSGSTGRPVEVLHSDVHRLFWAAMTVRNELWHQRDLSATMGIIRFLPDGSGVWPGQRRPSWSPVLDPILRTGPSVGLDLTTPIDKQAEWLLRERPDYLQTHPTNLHALARHVLDRGLDVALRDVTTLAESLSDDTRALCRDAFGAPVLDTYSSQEFGYLALQCPEAPVLHAMAEAVLLEVLDDDGAPVEPGNVGRIVVTSLVNWASPLIRYEIGDWAEVGPPCPCGRGLPVLTRILGRTRNMLRRPDGVVRWPYINSRRVAEIAPYWQLQVVQTSLESVEIRLVPRAPLDDAQRHALVVAMRDVLGYPFDVTVVEVDAIARSAAGKFEEFRSLLEAA